MSKEISNLLDKFYHGETTPEEEQLLEEHFLRQDLRDLTSPETAHFKYWQNQRQSLSAKVYNETIPRFQKPAASSPTRSIPLLQYVAGIALFITGFAIAWLLQVNRNKASELSHLQDTVQFYEQVLFASSLAFPSRVVLMESLIGDEQITLDFIEGILAKENDLHVKINSIHTIQAKYGSDLTMLVLNNLFEQETNTGIQIALLKLLLELDQEQANTRAQELLKKPRMDQETKKAIETLISQS